MTKRNLLNTSSLVHAAPAEAGTDVAEIETTADVSAVTPQSAARSIGAKAGKDLNNLFNGLVQSDEDVKRGPAVTLMGLIEAYGFDTVASWPKPGTTDKEGDNNPEVKHIKVPKQEGGYRTLVVRWYGEAFAGSDIGKEWQDIRDNARLALDVKGGGPAKVNKTFWDRFPDHKNEPVKLQAVLDLYGQRITKGQNYWRKAMSLFHALHALNEHSGTW